MKNDEQFSEHSLILFYEYLSQCLIDVGAHQGTVSLPFLRKSWQVIAFEPEQHNRQKLLESTKAYQNFTCIPKAVSDVTGEKVLFHVSQEHYGIHSLKPWHETHKPAYKVETTRLDDALNELGINQVTVLKIDIEGADFLALKGFDFGRFKPELVMVEFMDERTLSNFGYSHHDMAAYMRDKGYSTFVSEWAPIKAYGREGVKGEPHQWLQCVPYPLEHEPAWGNLIFVPHQDIDKFSATLEKYLRDLRRQVYLTPFTMLIRKIPGAIALFHWFQSK
jgi:FkbM family methyltransferase